jgi:integrase
MPELFAAEDRRQLESTTPHAFRHTFGTLSVEKGMPIDVLQYFLGHQSVGTTSIYNKAKKKRAMEEAAKYFNSEQ